MTIKPDAVLFADKDRPTAGDVLVAACRNDLSLLAKAAVLQPGQEFTVTFALTLSAEDVLATLRANGFVIEQHHVEQPASGGTGS